MSKTIEIMPVTEKERSWVLEIVRRWGADYIMSRGRKVYPAEIDAYYAINQDHERVGLATYEIVGDQCELVTLDAFAKFGGIGTLLLQRVADSARERGCKRLLLITTNENFDAMRFYQRRGMKLGAVHFGAFDEARMIKPSIPEYGPQGVPLRDEFEFEMLL